MSLTREQSEAVTAQGSVAVLAGAGTGKTYLLTHRYLHHLAHGLSPLQIVATTFTEAAAAELRSRIRSEVRRVYPEDARLLAELEVAAISTIHALCQLICQEYPEQSGLAAGFTIVDEIDGALWFERTYPALLAGLPASLFSHLTYSQMDATLRELLQDPYDAERSLELSPAARQALLEEASAEAKRDWQRDIGPLLDVLRERANPAARDRHEERRVQFLEQAGAVAGATPAEAASLLRAIDGTNMRGGSRNWDPGDLAALKAALGEIRTRARRELASGMMLLERTGADDLLDAQLPALRQAFSLINDQLKELRYTERIATFDDLELGALRALENPDVRAELRGRWHAFMIDEFQDTNPVQLRLIELLSGLGTAGAANLTTVGDVKQSIYGFRRAAPELSAELAGRLGGSVKLGTSFRSHADLLRALDGVFEPLLEDLHQPLKGQRSFGDSGSPRVTVSIIRDGRGSARAEAREVARAVRGMIERAEPVWDRRAEAHRPVRPGDVAVLVRTQQAMANYESAFAEAGIGLVVTSGEDLLGTAEARDAASLLGFLHNPLDDLRAVAVLRSPFFTVSDSVLARIALGKERHRSWWHAVRASGLQETERAVRVLDELLEAAAFERPVRLLQLADRLCGYTAVVAGLPGARRRLADWQGFSGFVMRLEASGAGLVGVVRTIAELQRHERQLPRPGLEAGDAVSLLSIHRSKGLEWPVVFMPDLSRRGRATHPAVRFGAAVGCALYPGSDEEGSLAWRLLAERNRAQDEAELKRVLYVGATRAADRLVLSASGRREGLWKTLSPVLEESGLPVAHIEPPPADFGPWRWPESEPVGGEALPVIKDAVPVVLGHLPVTSLAYYASCPKRFEYRHVKDHPGSQPEFAAAEGAGDAPPSAARRVGDLTHIALEHGTRSVDELRLHDPGLPVSRVEEALRLAEAFRTDPVFEPAREQLALGHSVEDSIRAELAGINFTGRIDAVTHAAVIDYKTDRVPDSVRHAMQLAVYAAATGRRQAMLAYLRAGQLAVLGPTELAGAYGRAEQTARGIARAEFGARPSRDQCRICEYATICSDAYDRRSSSVTVSDHG